MGEETKQEQAPPAPADEGNKPAPAEEKKEEQPPPPPPADEAPKEAPEEPKPPSPCVLFVDLHCVGCAKKIERLMMKIRGVEGVVTDMAQNQVTIKGVVEPQAICTLITKKTRRMAKVISPLPASDGEPIPDVLVSQVSGLVTVELNVNMHCEACALQLKKKILKMRGVKSAETEFSSGKVTVTGTMDADKLVDYVYRRTKKQARIVPPPEPEKPAEEAKPAEEPEKPAEEAKPAEEEKKEEGAEQKAEAPEERKKEGGEDAAQPNPMEGPPPAPMALQMPMPLPPYMVEEEPMKKMMYQPTYFIERLPPPYYYQPTYAIERLPPPQLFSDENPNACSIS